QPKRDAAVTATAATSAWAVTGTRRPSRPLSSYLLPSSRALPPHSPLPSSRLHRRFVWLPSVRLAAPPRDCYRQPLLVAPLLEIPPRISSAGVGNSPPKLLGAAKPTSSVIISRTLGRPWAVRHAPANWALDWKTKPRHMRCRTHRRLEWLTPEMEAPDLGSSSAPAKRRSLAGSGSVRSERSI